jgi:hypothetical protein
MATKSENTKVSRAIAQAVLLERTNRSAIELDRKAVDDGCCPEKNEKTIQKQRLGYLLN